MRTNSIGENVTEVRIYSFDKQGIADLIEVHWTEKTPAAIIFKGTLTRFQVKPGTSELTIDDSEIDKDKIVHQYGLMCGEVFTKTSFQKLQQAFSAAGVGN